MRWATYPSTEGTTRPFRACRGRLIPPVDLRVPSAAHEPALRDPADARRAARVDRLRAGRRGVISWPPRVAALDAALVRAPRWRDLDLHVRQVPEGQEPGARPTSHPAG